jgi:recombination protein RecA
VVSSVDRLVEKLKSQGVQIQKASDLKPQLGFIPSGSIYLDKAMGTRGYPFPKFLHLYGDESSGKSMLCNIAAGFVTRAGRGVIYYDGENNYSHSELEDWRRGFGIKLEHVVDLGGCQDAEVVLDTIVQLLKKEPDYFKMVVIDSVGSLTSTKTVAKDIADGHIDDGPRILSRFCKILNIANKGAAIFLISHMGANIGSINPEPIAKGGRAIRHWASLRLKISGGPISESKTEFGKYQKRNLNVTVSKNKISNPGGVAKGLVFDFNTQTFDTLEELIYLGKISGHIVTKGSYYSVPGTTINVHGEVRFKETLAQNTELCFDLFKKIVGYEYNDYFNLSFVE